MKTKIKTLGSIMLTFMLSLLAMVTGAGSGVMMADAAPLPDAGVSRKGRTGKSGIVRRRLFLPCDGGWIAASK